MPEKISEHLLGGLSAQQFLDEYWQQKPLLIRQAFPNFTSPVSAEDFAGLSCDTDAPSRIIAEKGLEKPWQVEYGSFDNDRFASLPETHWTLLVNDIDRYYPELRDLLIEPFRFIPDWRIDDLMVSFAVEGGSVGPHTDEYDVFLLQAQGQRHWKIADKSQDNLKNIPDIDLCILESFEAEQDWVLNPGDMLYLPPNVIHHGVALNDCMTYSIGFRAPSQQDLLSSYVEQCINKPLTSTRYTDPKRRLQQNAGEIDSESLSQLRHLLLSGLDNDPQFLDTVLGQYLTDTKGDTPVIDSFSTSYIPDQNYTRSSASRFAYVIYPDKVNFFASGMSKIYSAGFVDSAKFLCKHYDYSAKELNSRMNEPEFMACLNMLIENKAIYPQQEDNETF